MSAEDKIIESIEKKYKGKYGVICIFCLIMMCTYRELNEYAKMNKITIKEGIETKVGFFKMIILHYYGLYIDDKDLQGQYNDFLTYLGAALLRDDKFKSKI